MELIWLTRDGTAEASRETEFSGANGDREILIFPVQLTTSKIGKLTPVDPYSFYKLCVTIHTSYIHIILVPKFEILFARL